MIDEGLALWFPGPKSETGEDVAELQVHGGRAVIAAVLEALGQLEGFRHAEAGEFTRRAFENGRLDLTAVEGLADLVAAETEAQRRQALRQMQGEFARRLERWRERLIEARALLEAGIDFSDEGDVPEDLAAQAVAMLGPLRDEIGEARRAGASACATACRSRSRARPTSASRRCSTASPGARWRSCRRARARPAT